MAGGTQTVLLREWRSYSPCRLTVTVSPIEMDIKSSPASRGPEYIVRVRERISAIETSGMSSTEHFGLTPLPRRSARFPIFFNVVSRARNSFGLASAKTFLISAACLRLGSVAFSYPPLLSAARLFGFLGPLFGLALLGFDFVQRERKTPRKPGRTLDL